MIRVFVMSLLAILLLSVFSLPVAAQTIPCSLPQVLAGSTSVSGRSTTCYIYSPSRGSGLLQFKLESSMGSSNLYVREGRSNSLGDVDKVTPSAVSGEATYVLLNPGSSYTIGVVPTGGKDSYRLTAVAASSTGSQASQSCTSQSCRASYLFGRTIPLGSRFGDQTIFQVKINNAGRVEARASWSGKVRDLALGLYGVRSNAIALFARRNGSSPQSMTYDVVSTDLRGVGNWLVVLVNNSRTGGTASGTMTISYPH